MEQNENLPEYVYKYQGVSDEENIDNNKSIENLINSHAVFSTRKNFNDLFDSKIEFIKPTAKELSIIKTKCKKRVQRKIEEFISSGKFTKKGKEHFRLLNNKFNEVLDTYLFYCVSATPDSNLMWSHYANSHAGFCIEFYAGKMKPDKVNYSDEIPKINLLDVWAFPGNKNESDNIGEKIWSALRVKLNEWEYEDEYRFQLSNDPYRNEIEQGKKCILVPYPKEWVSSIIFGCRTSDKVKEYIVNNLPYSVTLKQAKAGVSKIQILHSDLRCKNA